MSYANNPYYIIRRREEHRLHFSSPCFGSACRLPTCQVSSFRARGAMCRKRYEYWRCLWFTTGTETTGIELLVCIPEYVCCQAHVPCNRGKGTNCDTGGRLVQEEHYDSNARDSGFRVPRTEVQPPCNSIDDVLTLILLSIVVSGGDFKAESFVWWSKAVRLSQTMNLNLQDERSSDAYSTEYQITSGSQASATIVSDPTKH